MGNWNITIRGVGAHHNENYEKDANRLAAEFVQRLEAAGHIVHEASITYGAEETIQRKPGYQSYGLSERTAGQYLEDRDKIETETKAAREATAKAST